MREIKFRAWDEKEKCWVSGFAIHQSGMFSDWAGCKKINGQCVAEADWKYQHEIPHIKIMQYTGLKDRNGRKIYEGDVLRLVPVDYAQVPEQIFVVSSDSFFEDVCYLQNISRFVEDSDSETDGIEVIGNIYESPELTKGEESE